MRLAHDQQGQLGREFSLGWIRQVVASNDWHKAPGDVLRIECISQVTLCDTQLTR